MRLLMVDLFSGLGGASAAMRDRGWLVVTVDIEPRFRPSVVADVRNLPLRCRPDLLWASPPCDEFAREDMPWSRTGKTPDLSLVRAALRAVELLQPRFWILENVRGAVRYLGPWRQRFAPIYLWGDFPLILAPPIRGWKERLSSSRPELRAMIPYALSEAVAVAVEQALMREAVRA